MLPNDSCAGLLRPNGDVHWGGISTGGAICDLLEDSGLVCTCCLDLHGGSGCYLCSASSPCWTIPIWQSCLTLTQGLPSIVLKEALSCESKLHVMPCHVICAMQYMSYATGTQCLASLLHAIQGKLSCRLSPINTPSDLCQLQAPAACLMLLLLLS